MRALSALLLFCVLALGLSGSLMAQDLNQANTQLLINKAKETTPGTLTEVTLTLNGMSVIFTVSRDALGSVTAKPKVATETTITQVNIQFSVGANGLLNPVGMVVQDGNAVRQVKITADANGVIAANGLSAVQAGDTVEVTKTVNNVTTTSNAFAASSFLSFTVGSSLPLPAGTGTQYASGSAP